MSHEHVIEIWDGVNAGIWIVACVILACAVNGVPLPRWPWK
jgi:hypothetical protein